MDEINEVLLYELYLLNFLSFYELEVLNAVLL